MIMSLEDACVSEYICSVHSPTSPMKTDNLDCVYAALLRGLFFGFCMLLHYSKTFARLLFSCF